MTKEDIKKALELCTKDEDCEKCPYAKYGCTRLLRKDSFVLIIEQEKEIERLKAENDSLNKKISELEQDLIHADENVFYRECDVKLAEDKIKKQAQIDVLSKVKERAVGLAAIETYHICNLIDELIKDVNENDADRKTH